MSDLFYHKELTDVQWNKIKFLFEKPGKVGRPSLNPRMVLNGILWILKSGARWRDLSARYGNWNSIYHKFRQWSEAGLFEKLLCVLVNERMQLLGVVLTGGHIHDSEPALDLLAGVDLAGKKLLADKAYSCQAIRDYLDERGALVCIPDKSNFKTKHCFDADLYKRRNIVERFFQRIKNFRHIATRFDKLSICFFNFVLLAAFSIHL